MLQKCYKYKILSIYNKCNTCNTMATTLEQHIKYSASPELFMKEKWLTFDAFKTKNYTNVKPFEYQLEVIRNIHTKPNHLVIKSRQMHISSIMELYIAWYVIFNIDKQVFILSHSSAGAKKILEHIKIILKNYSVDDEKDGIVTKTYFHWEDDFVTNNKSELQLSNGCKINVSGPSADAGKGCGIDFLYVDEAAFIKNFESIYAALGMAVCCKKNSKIIIASTPRDNSFFNRLALNVGEGYFNPTRLHWKDHNIYGSTGNSWYGDMCKMLGNDQKRIDQELECVINYSDNPIKEKTLTLRVSEELHKKMQIKIGSVSISDYIRRLIERDLS